MLQGPWPEHWLVPPSEIRNMVSSIFYIFEFLQPCLFNERLVDTMRSGLLTMMLNKDWAYPFY